ncbi:uncharacterized protein LOC117044690 [Lacerta agilis]|uniref:uncharacterized protein LOC117044690 n=1 Tax=Lacerta agilis TaxID=80427 RepID=UPI0014193121|nr:uncharacterized protein LOC117044690 [Lacerta agilis]
MAGHPRALPPLPGAGPSLWAKGSFFPGVILGRRAEGGGACPCLAMSAPPRSAAQRRAARTPAAAAAAERGWAGCPLGALAALIFFLCDSKALGDSLEPGEPSGGSQPVPSGPPVGRRRGGWLGCQHRAPLGLALPCGTALGLLKILCKYWSCLDENVQIGRVTEAEISPRQGHGRRSGSLAARPPLGMLVMSWRPVLARQAEWLEPAFSAGVPPAMAKGQ